MIYTKYGEIENETVKNHFQFMIGKVFKIIHLKEEDCQTIDKYVNSLCRKFFGISKMYFSDEALLIVDVLNGLDFENHDYLRSDIFEIIEIIEYVKKRCEE